MKHGKAFVLAVVALAVPALAGAQQPQVQTKHAPTAAEAQVIAQTQQALQSFVQGDLARFVEASGGSLVELTKGGAVTWDVERVGKTMKECQTTTFAGSDFQPQTVGPELIVLTYKATIDQVCNGKPNAGTFQSMNVFQRRLGKWRAVSWSTTGFVPAPPKPAAAPAAAPAGAPPLPALADAQAWRRAVMNLNAMSAVVILDARQRGESAQAAGKRIGAKFAAGWDVPAGADPVVVFAQGMAANLQMWPGTAPVVIEAQPGVLTLRYTQTYRQFFDGNEFGVTLADFNAFFEGVLKGVGGALGVDATLATDGEYGLLHVKRAANAPS